MTLDEFLSLKAGDKVKCQDGTVCVIKRAPDPTALPWNQHAVTIRPWYDKWSSRMTHYITDSDLTFTEKVEP